MKGRLNEWQGQMKAKVKFRARLKLGQGEMQGKVTCNARSNGGQGEILGQDEKHVIVKESTETKKITGEQFQDNITQNIHILEIDSDSFPVVSSKINQIINTENLSWNENCIAFYYVAKLANSFGIKTVVTANGIDELFCGYNAYREAIEKGEDKVTRE